MRRGSRGTAEETTRQLLLRSPGSQVLFIPKAAILLDHPHLTGTYLTRSLTTAFLLREYSTSAHLAVTSLKIMCSWNKNLRVLANAKSRPPRQSGWHLSYANYGIAKSFNNHNQSPPLYNIRPNFYTQFIEQRIISIYVLISYQDLAVVRIPNKRHVNLTWYIAKAS